MENIKEAIQLVLEVTQGQARLYTEVYKVEVASAETSFCNLVKKNNKFLNKMFFIVVRQKGSHVFMQRGEATVTVPLNNPVKKSTLKRILNQTGISAEELIEHL